MTVVVTVLFFASYADKLGLTQTQMSLDAGSRVSDVLAHVARMPGGGSLPSRPLVAVNFSFASLDTALSAGDEVAVIPPVAGG